MIRLTFIGFIVLSIGCASSNNLMGEDNNQNKHQMASSEIESKFPVSARAKMFILSLNNELRASGKAIEQFIPSEKLIRNYMLSTTNRGYAISGFIKTTEGFTEQQLDTINVIMGIPAGDIRTVHIPLKHFSTFLQQPNITYFELSNQLH